MASNSVCTKDTWRELFSFSQIQIGFTLVDRMYKAEYELNNCPFFVAPTKQESWELMSISQNLCHLTTNL